MANLGTQLTEKELNLIANRLQKIYREAQRDLKAKAKEHTAKYRSKDAEKRAAVQAGKLTKEEYKRWQQGQVFIGSQWKSKVEQMAQGLVNIEKTAVEIVRDGQMQAFADNANHTEYSIDQDSGFGMNFGLFDTRTVAKLVKEQPELLRRRYVDGKACKAWNVRIIANCITQGILQGESVQKIADRMARDTASTDMKAMLRYARTAMTGAQNAGRQYAMEESVKQGIAVKKVWLATLDDRTRDAHAQLDGQVVDVDKPFSSELGPIMYPGDPNASDANVWNCRCALGYEYPDSPSIGQRYDQEYGEVLDMDMTYAEWAEWRKGQIRERFRNALSSNEKPAETEQTTYKPDKYDAELAALDAKIEKAKADRDKRRTELEKEKDAARREYDEYSQLLRYTHVDITGYARFSTEAEFDAYKQRLHSEVEALYERLKSLQAPRREDYATSEEYFNARREYRLQEERLYDSINPKQSELSYMRDWATIEKARQAQAIGQDELIKRRDEAFQLYSSFDRKIRAASNEVNKLYDTRAQYSTEVAALAAQKKGVEWLTPKKSGAAFDDAAVVRKLAGPDKTEGCCASLAFAYVGNMGGLDVTDYRGGESRGLFSRACVSILEGMKERGLPVEVGSAKSYTTAGKRALSAVKEGKTYYFECAKHAAMVRKVNGELQYLEMQSGWRPNGWYSFNNFGYSVDKTLTWRFGSGTKAWGDVESYLVDADAMAKDERFLKLLGYINTEEDKQMKGSGGNER